MIKVYLGLNTGTGGQDIRIITGESNKPLPHIVRHSPTGLQWGYSGSGPADTAVSILTDYLGYVPAAVVYQTFKMDLIATAGKRLEIDTDEIKAWFMSKYPEVHRARRKKPRG